MKVSQSYHGTRVLTFMNQHEVGETRPTFYCIFPTIRKISTASKIKLIILN
jgi:hypothetical protein